MTANRIEHDSDTIVVPDAIEREIFIDAKLDRVWSLVSKTGFWVGEELQFVVDANEGETVVLDAGRHGRVPVRVDRLEPPRYAAYRWASAYSDVDLTDENTTLVEFTLIEREGGVLLRRKESGFATLTGTPSFRNAARTDNVGGWASQLERLRNAAE